MILPLLSIIYKIIELRTHTTKENTTFGFTVRSNENNGLSIN